MRDSQDIIAGRCFAQALAQRARADHPDLAIGCFMHQIKRVVDMSRQHSTGSSVDQGAQRPVATPGQRGAVRAGFDQRMVRRDQDQLASGRGCLHLGEGAGQRFAADHPL